MFVHATVEAAQGSVKVTVKPASPDQLGEWEPLSSAATAVLQDFAPEDSGSQVQYSLFVNTPSVVVRLETVELDRSLKDC